MAPIVTRLAQSTPGRGGDLSRGGVQAKHNVRVACGWFTSRRHTRNNIAPLRVREIDRDPAIAAAATTAPSARPMARARDIGKLPTRCAFFLLDCSFRSLQAFFDYDAREIIRMTSDFDFFMKYRFAKAWLYSLWKTDYLQEISGLTVCQLLFFTLFLFTQFDIWINLNAWFFR